MYGLWSGDERNPRSLLVIRDGWKYHEWASVIVGETPPTAFVYLHEDDKFPTKFVMKRQWDTSKLIGEGVSRKSAVSWTNWASESTKTTMDVLEERGPNGRRKGRRKSPARGKAEPQQPMVDEPPGDWLSVVLATPKQRFQSEGKQVSETYRRPTLEVLEQEKVREMLDFIDQDECMPTPKRLPVAVMMVCGVMSLSIVLSYII